MASVINDVSASLEYELPRKWRESICVCLICFRWSRHENCDLGNRLVHWGTGYVKDSHERKWEAERVWTKTSSRRFWGHVLMPSTLSYLLWIFVNWKTLLVGCTIMGPSSCAPNLKVINVSPYLMSGSLSQWQKLTWIWRQFPFSFIMSIKWVCFDNNNSTTPQIWENFRSCKWFT